MSATAVRPAPAPVPEEEAARLIGAGDGSVMLYCRTCREAVAPSVRNLSVALESWAAHTHRETPRV